MKKIPLSAAFFLPMFLLISCSSPDPANITEKPSTHSIVFSADFDNNGGCKDHSETDKCDLYTADLNVSDGSVTHLKRLTTTPTVNETYPAWNPSGSVVYYTLLGGVHDKNLGDIDVSTGKTATLVDDATWSEVSPDGKTFLYHSEKNKMLMTAPLAADGLSIGESTPLTGTPNQEDPDYSTDGRYILFHEIETGSAMAHVYDTQTKQDVSWNQRSGHCTFGLESLLTLCDDSKGGGIIEKIFTPSAGGESGTFGSSSIYLADPKASMLSAYDETFAACQGISFNYPTFCGDDQHLLVSTSCNQNGAVTFSRLFLIDFSSGSPVYHPLGKELADAYQGDGMSTWTVACLE